MISKSDKSDEVKIFKNTSVFTVRLHHRNVDKTRKKTCKNPLLLHLRLIYIRRRVGTPSGPRFGSPLGSQNRSQIDPRAVKMGIGLQTSILRVVPWQKWNCVAPRTPPLVLIYIYTRISRALRARSILSDLDLEAKSLTEGTGSAPRT